MFRLARLLPHEYTGLTEIKDAKYEWERDWKSWLIWQYGSGENLWLNQTTFFVLFRFRSVPYNEVCSFFLSPSSVFNYCCPFLASSHEEIVVLLTLTNHYSKTICIFIKDLFISTCGIQIHLKENDQLQIFYKMV